MLMKKIPLYITSIIDFAFLEKNESSCLTLNRNFIHDLLYVICFLRRNRNKIKQNYNQIISFDRDTFYFDLEYYEEKIRLTAKERSQPYRSRLVFFIRYEDLENKSIDDFETLDKLSPYTISQGDCFILTSYYTINTVNGFTS